jgi:hypothetical protein
MHLLRTPNEGVGEGDRAGRPKANLCLQPLEMVSDADIIFMHKLMIEADEETYLQTANRFSPLSSGTWL